MPLVHFSCRTQPRWGNYIFQFDIFVGAKIPTLPPHPVMSLAAGMCQAAWSTCQGSQTLTATRPVPTSHYTPSTEVQNWVPMLTHSLLGTGADPWPLWFGSVCHTLILQFSLSFPNCSIPGYHQCKIHLPGNSSNPSIYLFKYQDWDEGYSS